MRKFTFIVTLAFCVMGANAQNLEFVRNGQVVPDSTTIDVTEPIGAGTMEMKMDAEIFVNNPGTEDVGAILTISVLEGESIAFCGFDNDIIGQCVNVELNSPITKPLKDGVMQPEKTIKAGESIDPELHTMSMVETYTPLTFKTSFVSTVKYELSYGSTTKTVTVNFNYDAAGINSVNANANIFQAGNELNYSFDKAGTHQLNIYNVTGSLVKKQTLDTAGTVVLNSLNKGVYIYEVIENGKRIAAHKCVIR